MGGGREKQSSEDKLCEIWSARGRLYNKPFTSNKYTESPFSLGPKQETGAWIRMRRALRVTLMAVFAMKGLDRFFFKNRENKEQLFPGLAVLAQTNSFQVR